MDDLKNYNPSQFLEDFRGTFFTGEWPTLPEMFNITVERYPDRPCFTDWEGENGEKRTYSYTQAKGLVLTLANWMTVNGVQHGDRIAVSGKILLNGRSCILRLCMPVPLSALWIMRFVRKK